MTAPITLSPERAREMQAQRTVRRGGSRRNRREDEACIRSILDWFIPIDDVLAPLKEKVIAGDLPAIKLWLAYRWGEPRQTVEMELNGAAREVIALTDGELTLVVLGKN